LEAHVGQGLSAEAGQEGVALPNREAEGCDDEEAEELMEGAVQNEVKSRVCLKCGKSFESIGPGNRLCSNCNHGNKRLLGKRPTVIAPMRKQSDACS